MPSNADFYRGRVAESYEANRSSSEVWAREDALIEEILGDLRIPAGGLVLDAPVGTGRFVQLLGRYDVRLLGIDVSDEMLEQARVRGKTDGMFAVGDLTKLPIESSSVDVALCIRFAHLVSRSTLRAAMREFARTINLGGVLIIGARLESSTAKSIHQNRVHALMKRRKRVVQFRRGRSNSRPHSRQWLLRTLHKLGFEAIGQKEVTEYADGSFYQILVLRSTQHDNTLPFRSVELLGLPGAGKTTLFESLRSAVPNVVIDGFAAMEPLSIRECFRKRPLATFKLLTRLIPVAGELRELAARQVVMSALRQRCVEARRGSVVVFQEGSTHEVWRQLMKGRDLSDALISRVLPVTDSLVLLDPPPATLVNRLRSKRSPGPISLLLSEQPTHSSTWESADAAYRRLTDLLAAGGAPLIVLENSRDVATGVSELARCIVAKPVRVTIDGNTTARDNTNLAAQQAFPLKERVAAAEMADDSREWLQGARLWESVFNESDNESQRKRAGRRAAMSYRSAGELEEARRLLRHLIAEFDADAMIRREVGRFELRVEASSATDQYWHEREGMLYLQVVREISRRIASKARSLIDIGSAGTPVVEWFGHIPKRVSLDLRNPYRGPGVQSVRSDFLDWSPDDRFDVGLCLQVMEHVEDPQRFAERLLAVCEVVLISVPYQWPKGKVKSHVNDPVDEDKITTWFGRSPNYSYRIAELTGHERLICIYDTASSVPWPTVQEERFRYRWSLEGVPELLAERIVLNA